MKTALSAVAVAAVLAFAPLAGGTFAAADDSAQQQSRFSPEDRAAFLDARIAALKAGLQLNADQEKNWAPLEAAMRDLAKERAARMAAWRERREDNSDRGERHEPDRSPHPRLGTVDRPRRRPAETRSRRQAALRQSRRRPEAPLRRPFPRIDGPRPMAALAPRGLRAPWPADFLWRLAREPAAGLPLTGAGVVRGAASVAGRPRVCHNRRPDP